MKKCIAGVLAAAAICSMAACQSKDVSGEDVSSTVEVVSSEAQSTAEMDTESIIGSETESSEVVSSDEEADISSDVAQVQQDLAGFFNAVKTGDAKKLFELTGNETFEENIDSEEFKKMMTTLYGNMVWFEDDMSSEIIERSLREAMDRDEEKMDISVRVGARQILYLTEYDYMRYKPGDYVPEEKFDKETSWKAYEEMVNLMPLVSQSWDIYVYLPDGENGFRFGTTYTGLDAFLQNSWELEQKEDVKMVEYFDDDCLHNVYIGAAEGKLFHDKDGSRQKVIELLKNKDIQGAAKLFYEQTGEDFCDASQMYDEFTDDQKAYAQKIIDESTITVEEMAKTKDGERTVYLMTDFKPFTVYAFEEPDKFGYTSEYERGKDDKFAQWLIDNNIRGLSVGYPTLSMEDDKFVEIFDWYYDLVNFVSDYGSEY